MRLQDFEDIIVSRHSSIGGGGGGGGWVIRKLDFSVNFSHIHTHTKPTTIAKLQIAAGKLFNYSKLMYTCTVKRSPLSFQQLEAPKYT